VPKTDRQLLAEGYRARADELAALAEEMAAVSHESDRHLGDAPDW
jgi:hypothetical protein